MYDWMTTSTLSLSCIVILYIGQRAFNRSRASHPLPPGPPRLPWVGNVIGIDKVAPWETYAMWAKTYGNIVYSRLFGRDIIVINSEVIAKDLLEKRARNYSSRPHFVAAEMYGIDFNSGLLPYGDLWRLHRRFLHQTFRLDAVPRFLPCQHDKSCHLLRQLLDAPENLNGHVFEYTASLILNSTYGYDPSSREDELIDMLANVVEILSIVGRPDVSVLASTFPLLFRLPSWFPYVSFRAHMEMSRMFCEQYLERPFRYSLQKLASGGVAPSMTFDALQYMEERGISPDESWTEALKKSSGSALMAASETSHSFLMTFFLMMLLNPAAQEKAQAEIDSVVGSARLPIMEDRPLLPFVDAILRETLRHTPIAPLSVPHAAMNDDVYNGFHIPKGAIIVVNAWSIARDESRFPNPHEFIPERFLNDDGSLKPNDIEHIAFGFGRRICVGRYFADTSVWMVIAKTLAVFKILKPLDENGTEIPVKPRFSSGLVIHPLPFPYRIVPRFPEMDAEKLDQLIAASAV